ncbi:hypothetical protein LINGRAHAP2_LOCUS27248, partial [Linum grandiflorum]
GTNPSTRSERNEPKTTVATHVVKPLPIILQKPFGSKLRWLVPNFRIPMNSPCIYVDIRALGDGVPTYGTWLVRGTLDEG